MSMTIGGVGSVTKQGATLRDVGSTKVLNFTVNNGRKVKGEWENDYVRCSVWGKQAESLAQYIKPKTKVFVAGEFRTSEWEGKTNVECNVNTIQLLGGGEDAPTNDGYGDNDSGDIPF